MADDNIHIDLSAQDIDDVVSQFRLFNRRLSHQQMQKLLDQLPKLTEADIVASGHKDDVCPICFNTFLATIAEQELAHAMDSPAHPPDELGVTKLQETCGHIFCRKDIAKWIAEGHVSCPSCRRPLVTDEVRREGGASVLPPSGESWLRWLADPHLVTSDTGVLPAPLPAQSIDSAYALGVADNARHQFAGMYS